MRDRNRKKTRKQGINITRLSIFCPAKVTIRWKTYALQLTRRPSIVFITTAIEIPTCFSELLAIFLAILFVGFSAYSDFCGTKNRQSSDVDVIYTKLF